MASASAGTAFRHLRDLFNAGPVAGLEDGPLLARFCQSKDAAAFEALVGRHGPMVLATCRAVLKVEQDAEDAFQATFLVLARKAGSIRAPETLGGWLHRVAYRASVRSSTEARRRRRTEAEAARAIREPAQVESDLAAWLHEEIDRLPESLRLAVVFCDLEGLTYDEAASRLGWTLPRFRHRLAEARGKLKARLDRRGDFAPAIGASLAPSASAIVAPELARSAVASAVGGPTPASVAWLTRIILRGMLMARIQFASAALLATLMIASAGVMAAASGRPSEEAQAAPEPPPPSARLDREAPAVVEVRGIVLGPAGQPVAGARVTPSFYDDTIRPQPEATSGLDGRFSIRLPRSRQQAGFLDTDLYPWLVASAPGFGLGWTAGAMREGGMGEATIRLVEAGTPIEGRLVDLEGRPIAGVRVAAQWIYFAQGPSGRADEAGDLSAWLAARRASRVGRAWDGLATLPAESLAELTTITGADGRFRLAGVGRERIADLLVTGPSIVSTRALVMTRDVLEVRADDESVFGPTPVVFHAPRFDQPIAPGKPIRGVALDKETGRPIAGLIVRADVFDDMKLFWSDGVEATTEADGRYTLTGLPKAPAYRVFVSPRPGQPYVNAVYKLEATASPGLDPVAFDFTLKRGVVLRGRVTDKATGRPVAGHVNAFTFADSPGLDDYPGLAQASPIFAYLDADGRYEVVAPPGRAVIGCQSDIRRYLVGQGAERIAGYAPKNFESFRTRPSFRGVVNYHVLAEVRLDPKADPSPLDLQVDPGRTVDLNVVDPEGRPLGGLLAEGTSQTLLNLPIREDSPTVTIRGLDLANPRRVVVRHDARKLVGSAYLKGDEAGPVTIRLQPWGAVTGRVVDDEGGRGRYRTITAGHNRSPIRLEEVGVFPGGSLGEGLPIGPDGRFRLEGLMPGLKYAASAGDGMISVLGNLFQDVTIAPGEVKELGDLRVIPRQP